jgi:hypothetical protein
MSTTEFSLTGSEASIKGITRIINRHLGMASLLRIEVKVSSHSAQPFDRVAAKESIGALLREHGMGRTSISVRPFEGLIENANGAHLLRLIHADAGPLPAQPKGLMAWLAKWLPRWFAPASMPKVESDPVLHAASTLKPAESKMSEQTAAQHLTKAVQAAARQLLEDEHSNMQAQPGVMPVVTEALVVVRLDKLHQTLAAMVSSDMAKGVAASSIAALLKKQGINTSPKLRVDYAYRPFVETTHTVMANETDIEVLLKVTLDPSTLVEPTLDGQANGSSTNDATLLPGRNTAAYTADQGTAMPSRSFTPQPVLVVRVLGTFAAGRLQPFEVPFDLTYLSLPARIDRQTLTQSAFGQAHPHLLCLVSNSCPLIVQRGADKRVTVLAGPRMDELGQPTPMYRQLDTLSPLVSEQVLTQTNSQWVVNDPYRAENSKGRDSLPALVIELRCEL